MERELGSLLHEGQTSLLNRYRELIHLRASNPALASGELIPLSSSNGAVAAYLRRTGDRAILVIANLGKTALSGVSVSSSEPVMRVGRYTAKRLVGPSSPLSLRVNTDGRISGYVPIGNLAPMETYVFELMPARGR